MKPQSFQDYAASKGIILLKDDVKFIKECLAKIPNERHIAILVDYAERWLSGMSKCDIVARRQNLGRRIANLYLLGVT